LEYGFSILGDATELKVGAERWAGEGCAVCLGEVYSVAMEETIFEVIEDLYALVRAVFLWL
jgi:hypothetical protein